MKVVGNRKAQGIIIVVLVTGVVSVSALANAGVFSTDNPQSALDAKQTMLARLDAIQQGAAKKAKTHQVGDALVARPASQPGPPPPTGIIHLSVPFPSEMYLLNHTGWQGVRRAVVTTVYAGADGQDLSQGIVVVVTWPVPDPNPSANLHIKLNRKSDTRSVVYREPQRLGSLAIASVKGTIITLTSSDHGRIVRFDLRTHKFSQ